MTELPKRLKLSGFDKKRVFKALSNDTDFLSKNIISDYEIYIFIYENTDIPQKERPSEDAYSIFGTHKDKFRKAHTDLGDCAGQSVHNSGRKKSHSTRATGPLRNCPPKVDLADTKPGFENQDSMGAYPCLETSSHLCQDIDRTTIAEPLLGEPLPTEESRNEFGNSIVQTDAGTVYKGGYKETHTSKASNR